MYKYMFKCHILNEKLNTPTPNTVVYRCGPLIDLCWGPHVRHSGKIKSLKIYKNSYTYWEGKTDMETQKKIYGISFPDPKILKGRSSKKFKIEVTGKLGGPKNYISSINSVMEVASSYRKGPIFKINS